MELSKIITRAIDKANKDKKMIVIKRDSSPLMKKFGPYSPISFNILEVKPNSTPDQVLKQAHDIGWA